MRLHVDRERHREQQSLFPMFKQPSVRAKMHKFHAHVVALDVSRCIHFPFFTVFNTGGGNVNICCATDHVSLYYRLPHGQYGYSGHVINLPHYVGSFGNSLLRLPSELDIIVVRKEGAAQSHRDFRVRRSVVLRVLQCTAASN